jgi:hypothetical protein
MDLVNATGMSAAFTMGLDPDGTERIVVVVKGTFLLPSREGVPALAETSDPLVFADTFTGKPGFSAVIYESDFAPFKPRCDVLLVGSAYAPNGRETTSVTVGMRVGSMTKGFEVVGDRHWTVGIGGIAPSRPKPFTSLPITYDRAFGGANEPSSEGPALRNAYAPNPVGVGYFKRARDEDVLAKPVPNTQEVNDPVSSPKGRYRPMSFGPIGRNFESRIPLAGTYDQDWLDNVFPFLPANFDVGYYQAAPVDQQIPYPAGGELVQLLNLTPKEQIPFHLPTLPMPVEFSNTSYERVEKEAVLDTIVLEPDHGKLQLVWRASLPLKRNMQEISQVVIGRMSKGWYRARDLGKTYFPSLGALAASRREEA